MPRRSTAIAVPAAVSLSTSSSSRTLPLSGSSSPQMRFTSVVLPLPERPNSAVMPGVGAANCAANVNPERSLRTATLSMSAPPQVAAHAPHQELGGEQTQQAERKRQQRQAQCRRIAAGGLHGGVERQRQRAGDARNVGGKGYHRAEFAESRG